MNVVYLNAHANAAEMVCNAFECDPKTYAFECDPGTF